MPCPVRAETTTGVSKRDRRPASRSPSSEATRSAQSGSTRSDLVTTGIPAGIRELLQDREVLLGLGHDAFVGGDDQQGEVDPRRAGDHRPHEVLVAGDVHDSRGHSRAEIERREVEIDRDATTALLGQPVHGLVR